MNETQVTMGITLSIKKTYEAPYSPFHIRSEGVVHISPHNTGLAFLERRKRIEVFLLKRKVN